MAGFIYLSFFLVQFNIHFKGSASQISYFSSGYNSVSCNQQRESRDRFSIQKPNRQPNFKLNKRFHPENFFAEPEIPQSRIKITYHLQDPLVNEEQPITNYSFNAPSLRGPPAAI